MIDPRAIVDPDARLGENVSVGPFSIIGPGVEIGDGTSVGPHAIITGSTSIGRDNKIYQFCSIGEAPQHLRYQGEDTRLEIGDRNVVREFCTFNRGTQEGGGVTRIGDDNFFMAYCHVAHDCVVGSQTIFANCASIAGHVSVGDQAILSGFTVVHQFCNLGAHSITGLGTIVLQDIPPYVLAAGNSAKPHGINVTGLKRRGFTPDAITALKRAYKTIYKSGEPLNRALETLEEQAVDVAEVRMLVEFIKKSQRGIAR